MQIWPAIDIRGGKCVRLVQGDYGRETVYGSSPADMAARWISEGAECLHVVNLDGARSGNDESAQANFNEIKNLVEQAQLPIQIGGGLRDESVIQQYAEIGIQRFVIGTKALVDEDWMIQIIHQFPNQIILGLDAKQGFAAMDGWANVTDMKAVDVAQRFSAHPIAAIIYTDISRDGMLEGPNLEAMEEMANAVDTPVIASGGVTSVEDISGLASRGLAGCIIGKALYEGKLLLADAIAASKAGFSANN